MHFFPFCGLPSFADFKLSAVSMLCADAKTSKATHFSGRSAVEPGTLDTKEGEKDAGYFSYSEYPEVLICMTVTLIFIARISLASHCLHFNDTQIGEKD